MQTSLPAKRQFLSDLFAFKVMDLSNAQLAAYKIDVNDISNILCLMGMQQNHDAFLRTKNEHDLYSDFVQFY
jgi:hypothetical protein